MIVIVSAAKHCASGLTLQAIRTLEQATRIFNSLIETGIEATLVSENCPLLNDICARYPHADYTENQFFQYDIDPRPIMQSPEAETMPPLEYLAKVLHGSKLQAPIRSVTQRHVLAQMHPVWVYGPADCKATTRRCEDLRLMGVAYRRKDPVIVNANGQKQFLPYAYRLKSKYNHAAWPLLVYKDTYMGKHGRQLENVRLAVRTPVKGDTVFLYNGQRCTVTNLSADVLELLPHGSSKYLYTCESGKALGVLRTNGKSQFDIDWSRF